MKDLIALVEGKDDKQTLESLFRRFQALRIKEVDVDIFAHPQSGSGCLNDSADFFRAINASQRYKHALVVLDREGCGQDHRSVEELESSVRDQLRHSGWEDRGDVVVIAPELEAWIWSSSPEVDKALGWAQKQPTLREWLLSNNWIEELDAKPIKPKEALQAALREVRKPYSSSIHAELAKQVSLKRCSDTSFHRFKELLQAWFADDSNQ